MTKYVVLLPGEESMWERASDAERREMYAVHAEFGELLAARGHQVLGGAELAHSREARVLRTSASGEQTVTEGPYAETAEQLTGFYLVESENVDDLVDVCRTLGRREGAIEVRACVTGEGS